MENQENKITELRLISPMLAEAGTTNPYRVPGEYFQDFSMQVLAVIKAEDDIAFTRLNETQKKPFEVPPSYFDNLSNQIINRIRALDAISPKEELEALSPLLVHLDKAPVFAKPSEYFEELPSDILAGVNAIDFVNHELETLPGILNIVKNDNVYKVPDRYFERLPLQLLRRVKETKKAPVLLPGFRRRVINYAVAAMLTGVLAIGAWEFFQDKNENIAGNDLNEFEQIRDKEKISDDEIVNYLEYNSTSESDISGDAAPDYKEVEVKELLADVPDEELQQYLEQNAASRDLTIN